MYHRKQALKMTSIKESLQEEISFQYFGNSQQTFKLGEQYTVQEQDVLKL